MEEVSETRGTVSPTGAAGRVFSGRVCFLALFQVLLFVVLVGCSVPGVDRDSREAGETTGPDTTGPPATTTGDQAAASPGLCEGEPVALGAFVKGAEEDPEVMDRFADAVGGMPAVALLYED